MKNTLLPMAAAFLGLLSARGVVATENPAAHAQHDHSPPNNSVKAELLSPVTFVSGKTASTVLRLTSKDGKPLTLDQLQVAHTERLHLLVVDETLTDYHHEHPVAGDKPGEYRFDFSPRFGGTYYVWADVVPIATGAQEYAKTEVTVQGPPATTNKTLNTTAEADGYRFSLTTENNEPLQSGKATMVKIAVTTPDGKDFAGLEPVMGAYAHMVAFPENRESVTHIHPMGKEPETAAERGGPELSFHVEPEKPGFQKFFLQTQISGREVYAAFGLEVKPGAISAVSAASEYSCPMHPEVKQTMPGKCPKCGMAVISAKPKSEKHDHQH
ncbi:MAG: hypothetical protein H0V63_00150 [Burkholderiaceae bacterium]|nr:hypothetical protein [Burkholderiaceae bacterium]